MKKWTVLTAAITLIAVAAVRAEDKPARKHEGRRPAMVEQLLPPGLAEKLNLTAEQKAKYDELSASFKKDAEAWKAEHPNFMEDMKKAHEAKDKEAMTKVAEQRKPLYEKRKGYIEQLKASLTDEQKKQLEEAHQNMPKRAADAAGKHGRRGEKNPQLNLPSNN